MVRSRYHFLGIEIYLLVNKFEKDEARAYIIIFCYLNVQLSKDMRSALHYNRDMCWKRCPLWFVEWKVLCIAYRNQRTLKYINNEQKQTLRCLLWFYFYVLKCWSENFQSKDSPSVAFELLKCFFEAKRKLKRKICIVWYWLPGFPCGLTSLQL